MTRFLPLPATLLCALLVGCSDDRPTPNIATTPVVTREPMAALSQEYAAFRKSRISDVAYTLSLDLEEGSEQFSGQVEIEFSLAPGNRSPLTVDYDSGEILDLTVNGAPADYEYRRWFITLAPEQFSSGRNSIAIRYRRPFATDGAGLHRFVDPENGETYLYTNFEPYDANRLFPHFDQPNLKAPLTLDVMAPPSWQVIGNTRESSIDASADGRRHWRFPATAPISSYIYAMHAGPFTVWEDSAGDIPLRLFARTALAPYVKTEEWFVPTRQSFAFFQDYFESGYPFGKYDQVIVPDFNPGAMENVGAVTFNERYISRGEKTTAQRRSLANVIAHEMAHMWFGDLVTMDWWNGLWLNESFATYMANLELERASDFENTWDAFYSGTKQSAYRTDQLITTHPIELVVPTTADAFTNFDGITYGKGASVLKQLPYFLGEENFRQGVANYLDRYAWGNTSLEDFVGELAAAAGMDLSQWQREWLYQSGVNGIRADFACENGMLSSLRLLQSVPETATADKVLRTQRTQVGLYRYNDGEMVLSAAIPVTYSGAETPVAEAAGRPCPDLVFPNEGDWAYMKVQLDETSLATLRERINDFGDPTTRLMLWQALWDGVQDATLPLTDFVDFALANIGQESDRNVASQVAGNLGSAFSLFSRMDPGGAAFEQYQARIEDFLRRQLAAAEPGSDLQQLWFERFAAAAHSPEALDFLAGVLDGEDVPAGLEIDQDRRWSVLLTLNRRLHRDYERRLAAERARDGSDQGRNMALAAEAVRPLPEVKEAWLDTVIERPETYKLATLRAVLPRLFPAEQNALLEGFADRLLEPIPRMNEEAAHTFLDEYVSVLAPAACTEESVARLRRANEAFAGFQPLIVKAFLIHQQQDERCVAMKNLLL